MAALDGQVSHSFRLAGGDDWRDKDSKMFMREEPVANEDLFGLLYCAACGKR